MQGRRDFMQNGALLGLGAASSTKLVAKTPKRSRVEPHFFAFFQMRGAWDPTVAFEPKNRDDLMPNNEPATDQPYSYDEVTEQDGFRLAPLGMKLSGYTDRLAIVNGIDMEADNGHRLDAMMSGSLTARASNIPYFQCKLADKHPYLQETTLPHVYASYDGDFFAASLAKLNTAALPVEVADIVNASLSGSSNSGDVSKAMIEDYRAKVPQRLLRRKLGNYVRQVTKGQALIDRFDEPIDVPNDSNTGAAAGEIFGQLFSKGVVGAATLSLGGLYQFDTHFNHYELHPIANALDYVDQFCQALANIAIDENTSVFDRTTIFLTSEYSRTPRLNNFNGKDHNFRSNSMVIMGHQVAPGVYGRSGAVQLNSGGWWGHGALPIDYATGEPRDDGEAMAAENLWAGLSPVVGVDCRTLFPNVTPIEFLG